MKPGLKVKLSEHMRWRKGQKSDGVYTIFLLILFLCSWGCRQAPKQARDKEVIEDQLIIEVDLVAPEDDIFELYYRYPDESYSPDQRMEVSLNGSEDIQKVTFILDQQEFPPYVRIDLGNNPKQGEIYLHQIVLRYNEGIYIFDKSEIKRYFRPNKFLDFDFESMTGKGQIIDNRFDPYLDSNNISKFVNNLILY